MLSNWQTAPDFLKFLVFQDNFFFSNDLGVSEIDNIWQNYKLHTAESFYNINCQLIVLPLTLSSVERWLASPPLWSCPVNPEIACHTRKLLFQFLCEEISQCDWTVQFCHKQHHDDFCLVACRALTSLLSVGFAKKLFTVWLWLWRAVSLCFFDSMWHLQSTWPPRLMRRSVMQRLQ